MYAIALAIFGAMLFAWHLAVSLPAESAQRRDIGRDIMAANFWMYRESVVDFVGANASFSNGDVNDADLASYQREANFEKARWADPAAGNALDGTWHATVVDGTLYTYTRVPPPAGVSWAVAARAGQSLQVGITEAGDTAASVYSVIDGVNGMARRGLPAGLLPNLSGNLVVIGQ